MLVSVWNLVVIFPWLADTGLLLPLWGTVMAMSVDFFAYSFLLYLSNRRHQKKSGEMNEIGCINEIFIMIMLLNCPTISVVDHIYFLPRVVGWLWFIWSCLDSAGFWASSFIYSLHLFRLKKQDGILMPEDINAKWPSQTCVFKPLFKSHLLMFCYFRQGMWPSSASWGWGSALCLMEKEGTMAKGGGVDELFCYREVLRTLGYSFPWLPFCWVVCWQSFRSSVGNCFFCLTDFAQ